MLGHHALQQLGLVVELSLWAASINASLENLRQAEIFQKNLREGFEFRGGDREENTVLAENMKKLTDTGIERRLKDALPGVVLTVDPDGFLIAMRLRPKHAFHGLIDRRTDLDLLIGR